MATRTIQKHFTRVAKLDKLAEEVIGRLTDPVATLQALHSANAGFDDGDALMAWTGERIGKGPPLAFPPPKGLATPFIMVAPFSRDPTMYPALREDNDARVGMLIVWEERLDLMAADQTTIVTVEDYIIRRLHLRPSNFGSTGREEIGVKRFHNLEFVTYNSRQLDSGNLLLGLSYQVHYELSLDVETRDSKYAAP